MIYLDITRLLTRLKARSPTGIDRVEFEYARHQMSSGGRFVAKRAGVVAEVPLWLASTVVEYLEWKWLALGSGDPDTPLNLARWQIWLDQEPDATFMDGILAELEGSSPERRSMLINTEKSSIQARASWLPWLCSSRMLQHFPRTARHLFRRNQESTCSGSQVRVDFITQRAVYLNVGHDGLDDASTLKQIKDIPGVLISVFLHDALPVSNPNLFREGSAAQHRRRIENVTSLADRVFVNSRFTKSELHRMFPVLHVDDVLEIGVSLPETLTASDEMAKRGFVTIGTIEPRKNLKWLIESWIEFCTDNPERVENEVLTIFGKKGWLDENEFPALMELINGSEFVHYVAGADDRKVFDALSRARGYVTASHIEGWGMPVAESLALGTPVIATDIAAHREVSQGIAEFFPCGDKAALFEKLKPFFDPEALRQKQVATREFEAWTWSSHFSRFHGWFKG